MPSRCSPRLRSLYNSRWDHHGCLVDMIRMRKDLPPKSPRARRQEPDFHTPPPSSKRRGGAGRPPHAPAQAADTSLIRVTLVIRTGPCPSVWLVDVSAAMLADEGARHTRRQDEIPGALSRGFQPRACDSKREWELEYMARYRRISTSVRCPFRHGVVPRRAPYQNVENPLRPTHSGATGPLPRRLS